MDGGKPFDKSRPPRRASKEPYPTEYEALLGFHKKMAYPTAVLFIVVNEFCERFSFYGMKTILTLYLRNMLKYSERTATTIYHAFVMFSYLTCIPGAIIADSFLGKFRTIFLLSLVYAVGTATISFASAGTVPSLSWIPAAPLSFIGLGMIAIGTGGIKPCVSAFGGDQFQIPGQEKQLEQFFFIFYFAINMGSLISTFVTPILRRDVSCLDSETCYPLAFGLPSVLMVTSIVIFLIGKSFYKIRRPTGNVFVEVCKCVFHALKNKFTGPHLINGPHLNWLDYASDEFEPDFIHDMKKLFGIILLYAPLPVFWALFEQQGSRWTFQASRMNGYISNGMTIKPDQMQVVNSFMVILFIPLFDQLLYPVFAKCNLLKKPLQRIALGGFLASFSFVLAGLVEMKLEPTYANLPGPFQTQLNFVNTLPYELNVTLSSNNSNIFTKTLMPNGNAIFQSLPAPINYLVRVEPFNHDTLYEVDGHLIEFNKAFSVAAESQQVVNALVGLDENFEPQLKYSDGPGDDLVKSQDGNARVKIIMDPLHLNGDNQIVLHSLTSKGYQYHFVLNSSSIGTLLFTETVDVEPDLYSVRLTTGSTKWPNDYMLIGEINVDTGGVYLLTVYPKWLNNSTPETTGHLSRRTQLVPVTEPNSVHMLWLLPQYFVVTVGEVLFAITGYAFSYAEAPQSMKSVIQAVWLLTNAAGSFIVIIVTEINLFPRQMIQFFFFSGLMFIATLVFIFLAYSYNPIKPRTASSIFMKKTSLPPTAMEPYFQLSETEITDEDEVQEHYHRGMRNSIK